MLCENCQNKFKKDLSNCNHLNKNDLYALKCAGIYTLDHLVEVLWHEPIKIKRIRNIGLLKFKRIVNAVEKEIGIKIPIL